MGRSRLCFILIKDFLSKMMKKKKQKVNMSYVLFLKHPKHQKLRCSTIRNISKKFAEITNETVKKIQQLSYTKNCMKKADLCSIMARSCSLGFFRFGRDHNLCSKSET